jgi:hypothetical protein
MRASIAHEGDICSRAIPKLMRATLAQRRAAIAYEVGNSVKIAAKYLSF